LTINVVGMQQPFRVINAIDTADNILCWYA